MEDHILAQSHILIKAKQDNRYLFRREHGRWLMECQGKWKDEIGNEQLLDHLAKRRDQLCLSLDLRPFEGARLLQLVEVCKGENGGAMYKLGSAQNMYGRRFWLCHLLLLLFGEIPECIYFRKEPV